MPKIIMENFFSPYNIFDAKKNELINEENFLFIKKNQRGS